MANTFKGRKFGRERDQREALMAGLSTQLILNHSIKTTLGKAKELRPHLEKMITLAKKETLASRRLVIARLDNNVQAGHYLVDVIVPSLSARNSGYLRIIKESNRRGDNAEMARISFVDEIKVTQKPVEKVSKKTTVAATKPKAKKAPVKAKAK